MRSKQHDKFLSLGTKRVNNALRAINLIGNLSNRVNYEYSDAEVKKMFNALQNELTACRERFNKASKMGNKGGFSFD
ncbi:MAG: hypothetical protein MJE68_28850 [Proteobacteria bacterium]|nr:hypothetical protein [Pseudomonadota bacterium]